MHFNALCVKNLLNNKNDGVYKLYKLMNVDCSVFGLSFFLSTYTFIFLQIAPQSTVNGQPKLTHKVKNLIYLLAHQNELMQNKSIDFTLGDACCYLWQYSNRWIIIIIIELVMVKLFLLIWSAAAMSNELFGHNTCAYRLK